MCSGTATTRARATEKVKLNEKKAKAARKEKEKVDYQDHQWPTALQWREAKKEKVGNHYTKLEKDRNTVPSAK